MTDPVKVIGGAQNFWLRSGHRYDLAHPRTSSAPKTYPRMTLQTTNSCIIIDPTKSALVIIDSQNYFFSPTLGRPPNSLGLQIVERLRSQAIPACRRSGIPIVWLGWGLTQEDIEEVPPTIVRGFGLDNNFEDLRKRPGLGEDFGPVNEHGSIIQAGKALIRGEWNSEIHSDLTDEVVPGNMHAWKNRLSGFWGGTTEVENMLKERGIRKLIFAGCNTDQRVAGSLMDAAWKGYDCLLLSDGTATTSPKFAQETVEADMQGLEFVLSCRDLLDGADTIELGIESETAS